MPRCTFCGAQLPEGATFCDECGRAVTAPQPAYGGSTPQPPRPGGQADSGGRTVVASNVCPSCGVRISPMDVFCENCGAPLRERQPSPPPSIPDPVKPAQRAYEDQKTEPQGGVSPRWSPEASPPPIPTFERRDTPQGPPPLPPQLCDRCGATLTPGAAFCDLCGALVEDMSIAGSGAGPNVTVVSPPPVPTATGQGQAAGAEWRVPPVPVKEWAPEPVQPTPDPWVQPAEAVPQAVPQAAPQAPPPPPVETPVVAEPPTWLPEEAASQPDVTLQPAEAPAENRVLARIVHEPGDVGLALPVGKMEVTLGRDDPVRGIYPDLDLTDYGGAVGGVSRLHVRITIAPHEGSGMPRFYVEDLDSVNGTFVNEEQLAPGVRHPLEDGDLLRLGRVKVILQVEKPELDS